MPVCFLVVKQVSIWTNVYYHPLRFAGGDNVLPTVFLHDTFLYDQSDFLVVIYIIGFLMIQAMPWHSIFVDQTYIFRENRKKSI